MALYPVFGIGVVSSFNRQENLMLKTVRILVIAIVLLTLGLGSASAAIWSSTSASFLYGSGYELTEKEEATILTLEHASGWKFGDNFFFFDVFQPFDVNTHVYGEWHPRLRLGRTTGRSMSFAFVKDVLVATELNVGEGWRAYFYGVGFDLDIPHFNFFAINFFVRDDMTLDGGATYQISPSWSVPFAIGSARFDFRGFLDYAGSQGGNKANLLAQPQLLFDLGSFNEKPGNVYVGIEYQYWNHKYGIDGVKESLVQFMGKWVF